MIKTAKFTFRSIVLLFAVVCFNTTSANAQIDIDFQAGDSRGAAFDLLIGSTQTISIFASDVGGSLLANNGLGGYGLLANYGATSGTSAVASNYVHNPSFDFQARTTTTENQIDVQADAFFTAPPTGSSILLGSFDVNVSSAGTTEFVFADPDEGLANFSDGQGADLDAIVFANGRTFDLTINGVSPESIPEPSSAAILFALMACGATLRRRS